jgi:DNA-binding NarL/FixJ family response regulator
MALAAHLPPTHTANKPLAILLVDDHALFRAGMRFILADGELAGSTVLQAGSLTEALSLPEQVDVVLLDVQMPGINGMEGITLAKRRWPKAAVLMLSAQEDHETQQMCLKRGALAFVNKTASPEQIRAVVLQAASGMLAAKKAQTPADLRADDVQLLNEESISSGRDLSARQLDVLLLMCEGISNKAIARKLFVSENTVRSHVAAVLKYFAASTRGEAVMAAQKSGMVSVRANSSVISSNMMPT